MSTGESSENQDSSDLTESQLKEGAKGITYRADQMARAAMCPVPDMPEWLRVLKNARLESVLVNARVLAVFLYEQPKTKESNNKGTSETESRQKVDASFWLPNLVAKHYKEDFAPKNDKKRLERVFELTSKHLAHAVTPDDRLDPPGKWALVDLAYFVIDQFAEFIKELDGGKAAWFDPVQQQFNGPTQVENLNKELRKYRQEALGATSQAESYWRLLALRLLHS